MKTAVVVRAYYETPYMDFFIQYYLALGFDKITVLQADKLQYNPSKYPIEKVEFKTVVNTGDQIHKDHIAVYTNPEYDWILGIDADEFFIIDMEKYQNINTYMDHMSSRFPNAQQFMYRWICIDKMTVWDKSPTILDYMSNDSAGRQPIINSSKYIKSMFKTGIDKAVVNCHYLMLENKRYVNTVFDGKPVNHPYTGNIPAYDASKDTNLCDGFILHLHTRSLTNAVIKALVTKLLYKKVKDCRPFNRLLQSKITANVTDELNTARKNLYRIMGLKASLAKDNQTEGIKANLNINWEFVTRMINSVFTHANLSQTPIYDLDAEWALLQTACEYRHIDFTKLKLLLCTLNQSSFVL